MGITNRERNILDKASSEIIEIVFGELLNNLNSTRFLSPNNYLKSSTVKTLEKQFKKKPKKRKKFLSKYTLEYMSASALLHNIDAWTYFGHGISAILKGDEQTARHLFYYSELRASMSFLATQGIGVFSGRHIAATKKKKTLLINEVIPAIPASPGVTAAPEKQNIQGTHEFAWEAFDHYMRSDLNLTKVFDNYLVEGLSINFWLEKFNVNSSFRLSITRNFLKKLSFDIDHFSKDREARNEVSYRPSGISGLVNFELKSSMTDINNIWTFSQPDNKKGEIKLDFILLSELLQMAFKETHPSGFSHTRAKNQYNSRIERMLDDIGIAGNRKKELTEIFFTNYPDLFMAMSFTDITKQTFNRGMLYRAFIFIRLSNAFCNRLIKETPAIDKNVLEFWWKPLGLHFGLWDYLNEPTEFADLWQDFEDIKTPILNIINAASTVYTNAFWRENADLGFKLSTCPRIGFWGLGI